MACVAYPSDTEHLDGWAHWHHGGSLETCDPSARRLFVMTGREAIDAAWRLKSGTPQNFVRKDARCAEYDLPSDKPWTDPFPPMEDDEDAWLY